MLWIVHLFLLILTNIKIYLFFKYLTRFGLTTWAECKWAMFPGFLAFQRFRQPPDLVSNWKKGFANCIPTNGKITNFSHLDTISKLIDFYHLWIILGMWLVRVDKNNPLTLLSQIALVLTGRKHGKCFADLGNTSKNLKAAGRNSYSGLYLSIYVNKKPINLMRLVI